MFSSQYLQKRAFSYSRLISTKIMSTPPKVPKSPSKADQLLLAVFGEKLPTLQRATGDYSTEEEVVNFWLWSFENYKTEHGLKRTFPRHKNAVTGKVSEALVSQWESVSNPKVLKNDKAIRKSITDLLERVEKLKDDVSSILKSQQLIAESREKFSGIFDIERIEVQIQEVIFHHQNVYFLFSYLYSS